MLNLREGGDTGRNRVLSPFFLELDGKRIQQLLYFTCCRVYHPQKKLPFNSCSSLNYFTHSYIILTGSVPHSTRLTANWLSVFLSFSFFKTFFYSFYLQLYACHCRGGHCICTPAADSLSVFHAILTGFPLFMALLTLCTREPDGHA